LTKCTSSRSCWASWNLGTRLSSTFALFCITRNCVTL
jgi:hypothetical protein